MATALRMRKKVGPLSSNIDPVYMSMWDASAVPSDMHHGCLGLSYTILRMISNTPQIAAIHETRINQASEFAKQDPDDFSVGYRIVPDKGGTLLLKDRRNIGEIGEVIQNAGGDYWLGGFESFLKTIVRDSLSFDQVNAEVWLGSNGKPEGFVPVDPSTIRRWVPDNHDQNTDRWDWNTRVTTVQVLNGQLKEEFTRNQMMWGIRRPRSWWMVAGYGRPELEELLGTIAGLINGMKWNQVHFTTGLHAHTLLALSSRMNTERFQALERKITASLAGVRNSQRVPLVQLDPNLGEALNAVILGKSNAEMQFGEWLNFLLKLACALYNMDPSEVNFSFGNEGVKNQMNAQSPTERVMMSRERGLRPLMRAIAQWINYWIIKPYWPGYKLEFVGFDAQSRKERLDALVQSGESHMSLNEVREASGSGLKPLPFEYANHPNNAAAQAHLAHQRQLEMAAAQMAGQPQPSPATNFQSWMSGGSINSGGRDASQSRSSFGRGPKAATNRPQFKMAA